MSESKMKTKRLFDLPLGSVVRYRNDYYWLCEVTDGRVVINTAGGWEFVENLSWRSFYLCYMGGW